jgi:hypothetical protein
MAFNVGEFSGWQSVSEWVGDLVGWAGYSVDESQCLGHGMGDLVGGLGWLLGGCSSQCLGGVPR